MDFILQMLDFILQMLDFILQMMDFILQMMDFILHMMDVILNNDGFQGWGSETGFYGATKCAAGQLNQWKKNPWVDVSAFYSILFTRPQLDIVREISDRSCVTMLKVMGFVQVEKEDFYTEK